MKYLMSAKLAISEFLFCINGMTMLRKFLMTVRDIHVGLVWLAHVIREGVETMWKLRPYEYTHNV